MRPISPFDDGPAHLRSGRAERLTRVALLAAVALTYANAFRGTFQFDDWSVIVADPRVQSLGAWWTSMPGIRPLLKLTYALNHAVDGLAGFHLVNVALHAANVLLVLALLERLGRRYGADPVRSARAALVAGVVFALHPAQTEAVTYLSGRSTSLSCALALASILAWVAGRSGALFVASPLLFAAALAAKESVFVVPLVLVVLEAARPEPWSWRRAFRASAAHWAVLAAAGAAFLASPTYRRIAAGSLSLRPAGENLRAHLGGVAWLAGQTVRPDHLAADPVIAPLAPGAAMAVALVLLAAIVAGVALLRHRPMPGVALLWTVLWLAPSGWILPRAEVANDRQLYLALAGVGWMLGWALAGLLSRAAPFPADRVRPSTPRLRRFAQDERTREQASRAFRWPVLALALLLGTGTALRNTVYHDEIRFWTDAVAKAPANARARNNLAVALSLAGRRAEAEAQLVSALELDPRDVRAAVNLRLLREGAALATDPGTARAVHSPQRSSSTPSGGCSSWESWDE